MNESSDSSKKGPSPGAIWPVVFLVSAAVVAYFAYEPALKTSRPLVSSPQESGLGPRTSQDVGAVYARLWEDPLEAAYRDFFEGESRRSKSATLGEADPHKLRYDGFVKLLQDSGNFGNRRLLLMPILLSGGPNAEDREKRLRTRYAVLAGLAASGYKLSLVLRHA